MGGSLGRPTIEEFWQPLFEVPNILSNTKGTARFVYDLLLHTFYFYRRFPQRVSDIEADLLEYGLEQFGENITVGEIDTFLSYNKKTSRYKAAIREQFGFRTFREPDKLTIRQELAFLMGRKLNKEALKSYISEFLKTQKIEPPSGDELSELLKDLNTEEEAKLFKEINSLLEHEDKEWIETYLFSNRELGGTCQFPKQDSGPSNRHGANEELERLQLLRPLKLERFEFIEKFNPRMRGVYRRRFLADTPERSKQRPEGIRYGLAIIFCQQRYQEVIDNLVDHFLNFIKKMIRSAKNKESYLTKELSKHLSNLEKLYQIAETAHDFPKEVIEEVIYPAVSRKDIDQLLKVKELAKSIKIVAREALIKNYVVRYRSIIFEILNNLEFSSVNEEFLQALQVVKQYQKSRTEFYPAKEEAHLEGILSKQEQRLIFKNNEKNSARISRKAYECAILKVLKRKLTHKEVWVNGAFKYRDPLRDLPEDFEEKRDHYYSLLGAAQSNDEFVQKTQELLRKSLKNFDDMLPSNEWVKITTKKGKPWIKLTPLEKRSEPTNVQRLKDEVLERWKIISLLDVLKEVDLREGLTEGFSTIGNREILEKVTIRKRLLLCLFAIGTNTGLKRISGAYQGLISFEELRHIRRFFLGKEDLREAISKLVNAIFRVRDPAIWGEATTACAADSTQFGAYDQNLMTQWHPRYHEAGVMIYWHVSNQNICTSSEVASMLQGVISHNTEMNIESQYVDSHGKSEVGFSLTYLLGFDLCPRYKEIGSQKLYLPSAEFEVKNLKDITSRSIDWELIKDQYDEMIKHAVALKIGTAAAEAVIRKFSRSNYHHPTFKAFIELGKAIKTVFLCRYLSSLELRQQIHAGLNVVENWNSANSFIYYGKSGEMASNSREEQEISMLCLHLLQVCITYINTLMVQNIFKEKNLILSFKEEDSRALTPLFYQHINPYGTFELDLTKRLEI